MFSFFFVHTDTNIDFDLPKNPHSSILTSSLVSENEMFEFPFSRCKNLFTITASLLTLSHEGAFYEVSLPDTAPQ